MIQGEEQSGMIAAYARMKRRQQRLGFSLIELLVVVAVISLLVSILLPSLTKAKDLAKRAVCANQLRQLGFALHGYVTENDEVEFPLHYPANYAGWGWMVRPYTITSTTMTDYLVWVQQGEQKSGDPIYVAPEAFYCPALNEDQGYSYPKDWLNWNAEESGFPGVGKVSYITYEYFGNIASDTFFINGGFSPRDVNCPRLSEGVLFKDQANRDLATEEVTFENHPGGINIVYGDGHIEWKNDSGCTMYYMIVSGDYNYLGAW